MSHGFVTKNYLNSLESHLFMAMGSLNSQWNRICLLLFLATVASAIDVRDMNIDEYLNYINPPAVHKFQVISDLITFLNFFCICHVILYLIF